MNTKQELVECLKMCIQGAELEESPWMKGPAYVQHTLPGSDGIHAIERTYTYPSKLKPYEEHVETLIKLILPLLDQVFDSHKGWVGDGFEQILGRSSTTYVHNLWSIAHVLISAAHRTKNIDRVSEIFLNLARGGALQYRICALLNGVHVVNEMQVNEGVTISPIHHSPDDLNNLHPGLADMIPLVARGGCSMISIECRADQVFL